MSSMSLSRAVIDSNNTNNNVINERPPFPTGERGDVTLACIQNLRALDWTVFAKLCKTLFFLIDQYEIHIYLNTYSCFVVLFTFLFHQLR